MHYLATDLDGTFIPNSDTETVTEALNKFRKKRETENELGLIYITGRDFELTKSAIREFNLPEPDVIISDVGSAIHIKDGDKWKMENSYRRELEIKLNGLKKRDIEKLLNHRDISLQPGGGQGEFKTSFFMDSWLLDSAAREVEEKIEMGKLPLSLIISHDPLTGNGLIDLLPKGVSKASALNYYLGKFSGAIDKIAFAGDSGNDMALFTSGINSIIVGNTPGNIKEEVLKWSIDNNKRASVYFAENQSTAGVLEGCIHYGIV